MHDLATFQRDFANAIARSGTQRDALAVYRNTALSGSIDALEANYPVVRELVGNDMFAGIAGEFAIASPPATPVLATYGEGFAEWIEVQHWAGDLPYLPDVARCERMHTQSLFAADAVPLDASHLAETPAELWTELHLQIHPATRLAWLASPAMQIWLAHQGDCADLGAIEWTPEGALFVRPSLRVAARILDRAEHRFLSGIHRGESIGRAAIAASTLDPQADIGRMFAGLLGQGVFCVFQSKERTTSHD